MDKDKLISQIISLLEIKVETLTKAAITAHADATGEESKSENKYDTRGLEASYLAEAQANMVAEIKEDISVYKKLVLQNFAQDSTIRLTAFIELESDNNESHFYFIGPNNGGLQLEYEGNEVMLITPSSPLGGKLIGLNIGDIVEIKSNNTNKECEIINIC